MQNIQSNEIFQQLLNLQNGINKLSFSEDDLRRHYFDMLKSILLSYYNGYLFFEMSDEILKDDTLQQSLSLSPNQLNLLNIPFSSENSKSGYLSHHHRNLIISSYSAFELFVTSLCEYLLDKNQKAELLSFQFDEIKKKLKIEEDEELRRKFSKQHLTHVPIPRKYNKLFAIIGGKYSRILKQDVQFLSFLGDFRNTIHTNFIYYGSSDKKYQFGEIEFLFIQNKVVRYNDPTPYAPTSYLNIFERLVEISLEISLSLNIANEIPYPDLNATKDI